ncbi:hypothetical protein FIU88_05630 [Halomonas sp. THAF12]|uniref:TraR/DksA C4-type zinc finger protein n=1 Tax=Halomonas sp. THAF12 TaxID=2587849 RepID=UPI00126888D0|nr:TraR/DksA C4-type zinc finger protein [Halomonas sp. THAF12]QFT84459.1 hypothetical protein FIU88_05630 [Halomonas sp. THAF12]
MADKADIAGELIEQRMEHVMQSWPRRVEIQGVLAIACEDCGEEIPAARRQAAPWAATCIECQSIRERKRRHVR